MYFRIILSVAGIKIFRSLQKIVAIKITLNDLLILPNTEYNKYREVHRTGVCHYIEFYLNLKYI